MNKRKKKISTLLTLTLIIQLIILPFMNLFTANQKAYGQNTNVNVNFQQTTTDTPSGFIPDYGGVYGVHNGYTYGWNIDHSDMTVSENVYLSTEKNTYIKFHSGGIWEMALTNGSYDVTVSVGDDVYGSNNTINVEGINYWNSVSLSKGQFSQKTKTIRVNDGKLTVDSGSSVAGQTKLNYIEIVQNIDNTPPTVPQNLQTSNIEDQQVTLSWDPSTDDNAVSEYKVYRNNQEVATVTNAVYYTDTRLEPLTKYTYQVTAMDASNNLSAKSNPITITTATLPGNGPGVKAEYFNGQDLTNLQFIRLDSAINFDWAGASPDPSLSKDNFSIRWSGKLEPRFSEKYTFFTETHGGVRLWINNQLLIDDWNATNMVSHSGLIDLVAGQKYDIKMEYRESQGSAQAYLYWASKSQSKEIIPQKQLSPPFIPNPPLNFKVTTTSTTAQLSWDSVAGATGYDVKVDGVVVDNGVNTTYVAANLLPNTAHTYQVRAKVPEIAGDWCQENTVTTKIAVPNNLMTKELTDSSSMIITWDQVTGATGYEIEVDGAVMNVGTNNQYTHSGLMPNTQHTYRVRALNDLGSGDWSSLNTKIFGSDIPANIKTQETSSSITLTWDPASQAVGYDVEVDGVSVDNGLNTTFIHNGLAPNSQHSYRIRIRKNDSSVGPWSTLIIKSTLPQMGTGTGLKAQYFDDIYLANLVNTRIDPNINFDWKKSHPVPEITDKTFTVRWTGQVQPMFSENYTFYSDAHGGIRLWVNHQLLIDDWQEHNMSHQISKTIALQAGQRYDIQVEYLEMNGISLAELSWESASQTKEIIPQNLLYPIGIPNKVKTTPTETTINLTWEPVTYADSYDIEADGVITNVTGTSFTDKNLVPGTLHSYRIRARSGIVIGEWSSTVSAITLLGKPIINSNMEATENTISLSWNKIIGAIGYDIEVDGTIIDNADKTNYLASDLLSGTEHHFRARAKTSYIMGPWSDVKSKWTLPGTPQNLKGIPTSSSITVSWDPVRGATGYDIEANNTIVDNGNIASYLDDGLNPNTQHTYRIRAKNASGVGKWTPIFAKTTLPAPPTNLQGAATDTTVEVSWDPAAGATSYDLEIDGIIIQNITKSTYVQQGLQPNSIHSYQVRSKNADGASNWSNQIIVQTLPSIPTNLLTVATDNSITLTWDSEVGVTAYEVDVDGAVINNGNSTTYVHSGLDPNSEHSYRVRALNGEIRSFWSSYVNKITLPPIPTNLLATSTSTEIDLTWDMVVGATGYDIEADGKITDLGLNTSFQDKGLLANSEHTYRVRAKNAGGPGLWSQPITEKTTLGIPKNLATTATDTTMSLTWDPVDGATGYDIFLDGKIIDNGANQNYVAAGLEPFTWHVFRVRAKADGTTGDWSDAVTVPTLLGIPSNIQFSPESNDIIVSWDKVSSATGYEIEVDGKIIDNGLQTTFTHSNLSPNTKHSYRIRSKNDFVISEWSELMTQMTAPGIPSNLTAKATTNSITLTWDAVDGATSYDLEADGKVITDIKETQYIQQDLQPNTIHIYRIRATNGSSVSSWSEKLKTNTMPELKVDPGKDNTFNFVMVAPAKPGVTTRTITVTYNPDELEVLDLSANTPESNLTTGPIAGTNITVTQFTSGTIVYQIDNADTAVVNGIKFQAKTNNYSKVTYIIK